VVHRGDLDLAGGEILDRVVGAVVALMHLGGLAAEREASSWWPRQMPNIGLPVSISALMVGTAYLPVAAGSPGPLDRKMPSGLCERTSLAVAVAGHDRHLGALFGELAQDVALGAVVDGDDVELGVLDLAVALVPFPRGLVPVVGLAVVTSLARSRPFEAGEVLELGDHRGLVEEAVGLVGDDAVRHALFADAGGQRPRVDAGDADDVALLQPGVEPLDRPVVGRVGDVGAQHRAADARERRHVHRLDVLVVGADVADVREGEGDDLAGIGGIGEDLLVAGHRRVEADLARGVADGADAVALEARAIVQDQEGGRAFLLPAGHGGAPRFGQHGG
jgi:hypothetical protein